MHCFWGLHSCPRKQTTKGLRQISMKKRNLPAASSLSSSLKKRTKTQITQCQCRWASLPEEILVIIAELLTTPDGVDFVRIGAVCTSWHSAAACSKSPSSARCPGSCSHPPTTPQKRKSSTPRKTNCTSSLCPRPAGNHSVALSRAGWPPSKTTVISTCSILTLSPASLEDASSHLSTMQSTISPALTSMGVTSGSSASPPAPPRTPKAWQWPYTASDACWPSLGSEDEHGPPSSHQLLFMVAVP